MKIGSICRNGHILNDDTIYISPKGLRKCRTCQKNNQKKRRKYEAARPGGVELAASRPSPDMIAEAARRALSPRDLTASLMGDPPRGYSALDLRSPPT